METTTQVPQTPVAAVIQAFVWQKLEDVTHVDQGISAKSRLLWHWHWSELFSLGDLPAKSSAFPYPERVHTMLDGCAQRSVDHSVPPISAEITYAVTTWKVKRCACQMYGLVHVNTNPLLLVIKWQPYCRQAMTEGAAAPLKNWVLFKPVWTLRSHHPHRLNLRHQERPCNSSQEREEQLPLRYCYVFITNHTAHGCWSDQ